MSFPNMKRQRELLKERLRSPNREDTSLTNEWSGEGSPAIYNLIKMKILVPIDFPGCALTAVRYAIGLAKTLNAKIEVLHTYHLPMASTDLTHTVDLSAYEGYEEDCQERFEQLRLNIPEINDIDTEFCVEVGLLRDRVDQLIESKKVQAIVMGTTGTNGLLKTMFGSNASAIAYHSNCPVISIPEGHDSTRLTNIVFATDLYVPNKTEDLDLLKRLADLYHAKVYILHISKDPKSIDLDKSLETLNLEDYFKDISHEFSFLPGSEIDQGISDFIESMNIDMLAMRPGDHSWIEDLFGKSHTQRALAHTKIPMMTIHK